MGREAAVDAEYNGELWTKLSHQPRRNDKARSLPAADADVTVAAVTIAHIQWRTLIFVRYCERPTASTATEATVVKDTSELPVN